MSETGCNGWTNYETWAVALWLDNDEGSQTYWQERATEALQEAIDNDESEPRETAVSTLADALESEHEEAKPEVSGVYSDLLNAAFGAVEWREIARNYLSEIPVYSAGWNMPGYMPDNPPALFLDIDLAREHIADAMERAADEIDDSEDNASEREQALRDAAETVRGGSGELGVTVGQYHYFVTKAVE